MDETKYTIVLADGTELSNITMNGDNYIYPGKDLDLSIFTPENLSPVVIKMGDIEIYHPYMRYIKPYTDDEDNTWFILSDIPESTIKEQRMNEALSVMAQAVLDDDTASKAMVLFPEWSGDSVSYSVDDRVRYDERLAKCLQDHVSQPDWAPGVAPSLWAWLGVDPDDPSTFEWPAWIQPLGSHDAYQQGAKVSHNGKHWISDVDNNVWEPGVAGWTEQAQEE